MTTTDLEFANYQAYVEFANELGVNNEEAKRIQDKLGRLPNRVELGMISGMWSEHCSYKSSRFFLKKLPTKGKHVLLGPGENAGVVDFGDNLALSFKIESHNHPSFIEPYQGAATGVGGILRDIFTMGARPVAFMNSLRFGDIAEARMKYLVKGVVKGIGGYGNCVGIPTVGGEVYFHPAYQGNILVNAFCAGFVDKDKIFLSKAEGEGNLVVYLGSKTGRDGIHGASMASDSLSEEALEKRPTVQVGDPLIGKLLMEATLELMNKGLIISIQDMGAAGLTCSCCEMADKGEVGMEVNLNQVPCRETGMIPFEMLLSESQERMLLVCKPEDEQGIKEVADKWGVDATAIGKVTSGDRVKMYFNGELVVDLPPHLLTSEAPVYQREIVPPAVTDIPAEKTKDNLAGIDAKKMLHDLLASANLSSRAWVYQQYDYNVGTNTVLEPGSDAAIIRHKESQYALTMTTNGNSFYCAANPYRGAQIAVAECVRNLACVGSEALATTNCLNFGNPEHGQIMWQFNQVIEGMRDACELFQTPVISGNVSFYNQNDDIDIPPTPVIAMCGRLNESKQWTPSQFTANGHSVYLVGNTKPEGLLTGEVYRLIKKTTDWSACPQIDLSVEKSLAEFLIAANGKDILASAHDCSEGGLAAALAECCFSENQIGASVQLSDDWNVLDLFCEDQSRVIVSVAHENKTSFEKLANDLSVKIEHIGETGGDQLSIQSFLACPVKDLQESWKSFFNNLEE